MEIRLDGRSAIITGGSLGIGRAVAARMAASGANVAIVARRADVLNEARDAIAAILKPWFLARSVDEIRTALDAVGACWGPYQTFAQAVHEDPRVSTDNPMFQMVDQPGVGPYLASGEMLDFGALPRGPVKPAPRLGENTDDVLASVLGLSDGEIGRLHDQKIISGSLEE